MTDYSYALELVDGKWRLITFEHDEETGAKSVENIMVSAHADDFSFEIDPAEYSSIYFGPGIDGSNVPEWLRGWYWARQRQDSLVAIKEQQNVVSDLEANLAEARKVLARLIHSA